MTMIIVVGGVCVCVVPGFAAANYSDCSAAGGSVVCRQLLPVVPSPARLLVGIWSSAIQQTHMLRSFCKTLSAQSKN